MSQRVCDLELGVLYMTVKIPPRLPSTTSNYAYLDPPTMDLQHYLVHGTCQKGPEDFEWGLYLHHGGGGNGLVGKWYCLQNTIADDDETPRYKLLAHNMTQSPRLVYGVVGLIQLMHVPVETAFDVMALLDEIAPTLLVPGYRSFFWAARVYVQVRKAVGEKLDVIDQVIERRFDYEVFLREGLEFVISEIPYAQVRQLPRPILKSQFGVDMENLPTRHTATAQEIAMRTATSGSKSKKKQWKPFDLR